MQYRSPFVGKYLFRNTLAALIFTCFDAFFSLVFFWKKRHFTLSKPKKILISNIAQIGDVVMTTSLLPVIKAAMPETEIGMIVGSCAASLIKNHPLVDHLHIFDHWKISRKGLSHYFQKRRAAIRALRNEKYDVVIECCYYFPSTAFLSYLAKIPVRIGYTSAGFGPFLTHPIQFTYRLQSAAEHFAALLSLVVPIDHQKLWPTLPQITSFSLPIDRYIVIHMGSGNQIKEWEKKKWKMLCSLLEKDGHVIVFTGVGEKEAETVRYVKEGLKKAYDATNQVSLLDCVELIRGAQLLIGVDTGVAHIAAATSTPSILLFCGINAVEHWGPKSPFATIMISKETCYPCYRMDGCSSMACIQKLTVPQVHAKIRSHFESTPNRVDKTPICHQ